MKTGYILFGHGSRVAEANDSVRQVARGLAARGGYSEVETAFLELAEPDLAGAVAELAGRGVQKIHVIPYFLTLGIHLRQDLPRIVGELSGIHTDVEITVAPPLDGHPALLEIVLDRAASANQGSAP